MEKHKTSASNKNGKGILKSSPSNKQKGEVITWDGSNEDGRLLKLLVDQGVVTDMKQKEVVASFPVFEVYNHRTFSSSLSSYRQSFQNAIEAREDSIRSPLKFFMYVLFFIYTNIISYFYIFTIVIYTKIHEELKGIVSTRRMMILV